jgi:tetratricopeptide (TPR) repeat protein
LKPGTTWAKARGALLLGAWGALAVGCATASPPVSKIVNGQVVVARAIGPDAYEHVARALLFEEEQRWEEAAQELRRALSFDDQSPETRAQLADVLVQLGQLDEAADEVERSLAIEPTVVGYSAAAHLAEARRDGKALERYRQAATLALGDGDPEAIEATHLSLANAQLAALDLPGAHATIRALATAAPDSVRARVEVGALAWAEGSVDEAEGALKEALTLEPEQIDARLMLAALQVATGRPLDAKATFRDALERAEDSAEVAEMYLKWLSTSGDQATANEEADRLTPDVIDENTIDTIVRIERAAGRPDRAKAAAERALGRGVDAAHVALLIGGALADAKDYKGAAARFLKVSKGDPDFIESRLRAAEVLRRAGGASQLSQAERALDDAMAVATAEAAAPPAPAATSPKPGVAPKAPDEATAGRPRDWISDLIVARALLDEKRGDPTRALRGLDLALQKSPDDPRFLLVRAAIDERHGEWRAAVTMASKILVADPRNVEALNFVGFVAADHGGDLKTAIRQLQVAMVLDPGAGGIVDSLGWAYLRIGDMPRAAEFLTEGDRLEPGDPEILSHLGELYSLQKQTDRAVATYRKALEHDPEERVARDIQTRLRALEPASAAGR